MPGIASAATAVVIGHVAGGTKTIRVGAGGVMLPNHAPLVIAEQFGTLAALFPGRIELGLGRAPGTDRLTARALRRDLTAGARGHLPAGRPRAAGLLRARRSRARRSAPCPGPGSKVPLWLLGSSLYSAQLAAMLGLPFAFASHFAPDLMRAGGRDLPRAVPALRAARAPVRHARPQRLRGGHGRGSGAPVHVRAAGVRDLAPRRAGAAPAARGHDGRPVDGGRAGPCRARPGLPGRRIARDRPRRPRAPSSIASGPTR